MDPQQLTFGLELETQTRESPTPRPADPVVWVKELAVYAEWKPEALLRKISLRRGLNVLWARPGEQGLSGHAAGKTIFCRLLRYLLGDANWGKEAFRDAFRQKFPKAWVAGEVHLQGKPWLVARYLGVGTQRHWAAEGLEFYADVEEIHQVTYAEFLRRLEQAVLENAPPAPMAGEDRRPSWSIVLPWLTRDQESRYADLAEWRSPLSQSDSPGELSKAERCNLIRSLLGLLSHDEREALRRHTELLARRRQVREEIPKRQYAAERDVQRFGEDARIEASDSLPGELFLEQGKRVLAKLRTACRSRGPAEAERSLAAFEDRQRHLAEEHKRWEERRARAATMARRCQLQSDRASGRLDDEAYRQAMAEEMAEHDPCGAFRRDAEAVGCPLAIDPATANRKEDSSLFEEMAARAHAILAELNREGEERERRETTMAASLEAAREDVAKQEALLQKRKRRLEKLETLYANVREAVEALGRLADERELLDAEVARSQESLRTIREKANREGSLLSACFERIIRQMLTPDVEARVDLEGREIRPEILFNGDLSSAAIETVKILAFDLAALAFGAQGHGHHPRFLLHDSPREADLAGHIYRRLFQCALDLEGDGEGGEPNFQYIITTTEPPPRSVETAGALLDPVLDAARAEGRLLSVDV